MTQGRTRLERIREALFTIGVRDVNRAASVVDAATNNTPNVRIVVGPDTRSLQVFVDGKDVTRALGVLRLVIEPLEINGMVEATFTVHAQAEVELLPENVTVVVTDPSGPAYAPNKDKPYTGVVMKP